MGQPAAVSAPGEKRVGPARVAVGPAVGVAAWAGAQSGLEPGPEVSTSASAPAAAGNGSTPQTVVEYSSVPAVAAQLAAVGRTPRRAQSGLEPGPRKAQNSGS